MKKVLFIILSVVVVVVLFLFFYLKDGADSSGIVRNVVIYKPSTTIGSLYNKNMTFDKVDRTLPEGTLFCKTKSENPNQVKQLYTASANKNKYMMKIIRERGVSIEFKNEISQKKLLFSFYYYGTYGPPLWFCVFESADGALRSPFIFEKENNKWREVVDSGKYPVIIAVFDLGKKHKIFDGKIPLNQKIIDAFINDCRDIDTIISAGMAKDPEHYGPVQMLR